jgi:hypothetical protein
MSSIEALWAGGGGEAKVGVTKGGGEGVSDSSII